LLLDNTEVAMWKAFLASVAAVVITSSSFVFAQQAPAPAPAPDSAAQQRDDGARRARPSADDLAALVDARVAALKAGLKLTPEQEKNWPAVETAIRAFATERFARMGERRERREASRQSDPIERLRQGADAMTATAAGMRRLADAADPLYKSLDDGQKRRFAMLARSMGSGPRGMSHWRARRGHGPQ
jgi:zinc resistance-associated protein